MRQLCPSRCGWIAGVAVLASLLSVAAAVPFSPVVVACHVTNDRTRNYRITASTSVTARKTALSTGSESDLAVHQAPDIAQPSSGTNWAAGVAFAQNLQAASVFPTMNTIVSATWENIELSQYSRDDRLTFVDSTAATYTFTKRECGAWLECGWNGLKCYSGLESCCGGNAPAPRCATYASNATCCAQADNAAVCASGSSCCKSRSSVGNPTCCAPGMSCCGSERGTTCCPASDACDPVNTRCVPFFGGRAATEYFLCAWLSNTEMMLVNTDTAGGAEGTRLERWSLTETSASLLRTERYAALHKPATSTENWGEGVAFGATMYSRGLWNVASPPASASWDTDARTGLAFWQLYAQNGQVTSFSAERCFAAANSFANVVPPPAPTSAPTYRVCGTHGGLYFEVATSAAGGGSGTTLRKFDANHALIDTQSYAALYKPAPGTVWGDGVGFASTMQTRNAWLYSQPTQTATWTTSGAVETWSFTTDSGASFALASNTCQP